MSLRDEMAALKDQLMTEVVDGLGFLPHTVALRTYQVTGAHPDAGIPGTRTPVDTPMSPKPKVELRAAFRYVDGGIAAIADARVTSISRVAFTEAELRAADAWLIDGEEFSLIDGGLETRDLEYRALLKRKGA
jgi:hypothetical protein